MKSNKTSQPNDPEVLMNVIGTIRAFTGMVLLCFSDEEMNLKDRIAGNFVARGMTCVDSIYKMWESGSEQDAVNRFTCKNHDQLVLSLFDYIETFYNTKRAHSALGYLSPEQYAAELNINPIAA